VGEFSKRNEIISVRIVIQETVLNHDYYNIPHPTINCQLPFMRRMLNYLVSLIHLDKIHLLSLFCFGNINHPFLQPSMSSTELKRMVPQDLVFSFLCKIIDRDAIWFENAFTEILLFVDLAG